MHDDREDSAAQTPVEWQLLDDPALLDLVREGDRDAYAELYARHSYIAVRLARNVGRADEVDDVVAQAFANVLDLLTRGKGPQESFRAYLLTAVRHEANARVAARQRVIVTEDDEIMDSAVEFGDGRLDDFETTAIRAAYESLPARWRTVIWKLDVEGHKPHEVADQMGLASNAVSALVYRARGGLRDAYLQAHVRTDTVAGPSCEDIRPRLAASVSETAAKRDREKVFAHLATCEDCMTTYLHLAEVNGELGPQRRRSTGT